MIHNEIIFYDTPHNSGSSKGEYNHICPYFTWINNSNMQVANEFQLISLWYHGVQSCRA